MPYNINKSNGDLLVTVEDGTADLNTTSLALVGRNYAGYGEYLNENLVHLLENFARSTQPSSPLLGQLWYDSTNQLLKVYNGVEFVSSGGGVELDRASVTTHYLTFVETEIGLPQTKTAKEKGLNFQPSSGNFAINKVGPGTSKLEINNGINSSRTLNTQIAFTALHIHSDDNAPVGVLIDGYGGASGTSPKLTFRRGPLIGESGAQAATPSERILGSIGVRGHNGVEFSTNDKARVDFVANQTWTATANGTRIEFYVTANGTITPTLAAVMKNNGDFEVKGDVIGFSLSDERLKTNIEKIENALDKIDELQGVLYNWNDLAATLGKDTKIKETGLLANGVAKVLPEATQKKDNGMLAVNYEKLMGLIVEGIKELRAEVGSLKNAKAV